MSWFTPIINAQYCRAKKSGSGYNLTPSQIREIKRKVNRFAKNTKQRAAVIRDFSVRLGCYEGTVRRAASR